MDSFDIASTMRTKVVCLAASGDSSNPSTVGKASRKKSQTKNKPNALRTIWPHHCNGWSVAASFTGDFSGDELADGPLSPVLLEAIVLSLSPSEGERAGVRGA